MVGRIALLWDVGCLGNKMVASMIALLWDLNAREALSSYTYTTSKVIAVSVVVRHM